MRRPYLFRNLLERGWWNALLEFESAASSGGTASQAAWSDILFELSSEGFASLDEAVADVLLWGEGSLAVPGPLPDGLRLAALRDLEMLAEVLAEFEEPPDTELVPLRGLGPSDPERCRLARQLRDGDASELLPQLVRRYRERGTGIFGRHRAFRWIDGRLQGVTRPAQAELAELFGLERQLSRVSENVERFLRGAPALHTLLYGPRGSGKSTTVRALLDRYGDEGIRLVELPPHELRSLPDLAQAVAGKPYRFVAFVDDLSFADTDDSYRALRTLLDGSLVEPSENLLVIATSNRRHLVKERFSERPQPEDDDVHAWDSSNESIALADRFGLVVTFPGADQRRYLELVFQLAGRHGIRLENQVLEREALRFADWGNGYSGRTARQFIDSLR